MAAEETLIIKPKVKIKVFGVGGGGNSVLMRMGRHKDLDIDLIAINTDAKQLSRVAEEGVETLQIGEDLTKGRGTGGNIALGEKAALDAADKIRVLCDPCIQNGTNDALSSDFVTHCIRTPVVDFPFQIFHI